MYMYTYVPMEGAKSLQLRVNHYSINLMHLTMFDAMHDAQLVLHLVSF